MSEHTANTPSKKPIEQQRIAIIGGGPSGISVMHAFKSAANKGNTIPEVVCFEKQSNLGGLWIYSWRTGLDENNEPVPSTMYRHLWVNGPKEVMEFPDYTFMEHFKKPIPAYPPREVMLEYILARIEKANIMNWVKFNTTVHDVKYNSTTEEFTVTYRHLKMNGTSTKVEDHTEMFDFVFVCTGHLSFPNKPYFPGFENFDGLLMHSGSFRDASQFANSRVLIIGSSYSAEDIASNCYKFGCKDITISQRTIKDEPWPKGIEIRPLLTRIKGNLATFKDGSTKEVDAIILCTGYKHHFPFMSEDLRLFTDNRFWCDSLYNGIFFEKNPRVMYIGMQNLLLTLTMFDAQAWYAREYVLGKIQLPSKKKQAEHFKNWRERESNLTTEETMVRYQVDYVKELVEATDYPSFNGDDMANLFSAWLPQKHEDLMTYRDQIHASLVTGTVSSAPHTPWLNEKNESKEHFLNTK